VFRWKTPWVGEGAPRLGFAPGPAMGEIAQILGRWTGTVRRSPLTSSGTMVFIMVPMSTVCENRLWWRTF